MENEYQEIDLLELAKHILRKWWLIILFMVVASGTAYFVTKTMITPIYSASTTLFIGREANSLATISMSDLYVGNQLVTDYNELVKTETVAEEVISGLALNAKAMDIRGNLSVQIIKDSRFMRVTFKDPSPEMAVLVANKLSDVLKLKAEEIVGVKNVQIVDYAKLPTAPISPSRMKNTAIAGILGMMLALFVIFIEMMLKNTIEKEDDVESGLGLPVLGSIPVFEGGSRS